jgi:GMP synthase-like glutamine amidotransferase
MAVQHARLPRFGVQFHPESILSPEGPRLLANFLAIARVPLAPGRGRVIGEDRAA